MYTFLQKEAFCSSNPKYTGEFVHENSVYHNSNEGLSYWQLKFRKRDYLYSPLKTATDRKQAFRTQPRKQKQVGTTRQNQKSPTGVVRQTILTRIEKPFILVSAINSGVGQHPVQLLCCVRFERLLVVVYAPICPVYKSESGKIKS